MRHEVKEDKKYNEQWVNTDHLGDLHLYVSIEYTANNSKNAKKRMVAGLDRLEQLVGQIRSRVCEEES